MSEHQEEHIEPQDPQDDLEPHDSRGTFVILLAYLVVIVGLWGTVYFTLLARG